MKHISRLIFPLVLLFSMSAYAADVRLSWVPPIQCEDNSPISNCPLSGFEVSEASTETSPFAIRETVAATVTNRVYTLPPGRRCFSVKAVSNSVKSAASNIACVDVPFLPPKAPSGITVTVQLTVATP